MPRSIFLTSFLASLGLIAEAVLTIYANSGSRRFYGVEDEFLLLAVVPLLIIGWCSYLLVRVHHVARRGVDAASLQNAGLLMALGAAVGALALWLTQAVGGHAAPAFGMTVLLCQLVMFLFATTNVKDSIRSSIGGAG